MKILTTIKQVPDYQAKLKINSAGTGVQLDGVKMIANPFDEISVEQAILIL